MNKKLLLGLLVITLLVLTSCSAGTTFNGFKQSQYKDPATIDYFTGTDALTLDFLDQAPPDTVFEGSDFDVQAIIQNKGAYDVVNDEDVQIEIVSDSANVLQLQTQGLDNFYLKDTGKIKLHGKSYFYPEGEKNFFALNRYRARDIVGNFEKNKIGFYVTACYPYRTHFSDEVCIDTTTDKLEMRKQVCKSEDHSYSKGQGAPVTITSIETNMIPKGAYIEPQFVINIENKGDGIISFFDSENPTNTVCNAIGTDQVNEMELKVNLGDNDLQCVPNPVFFRDGKAKVECRLAGSQVLATAANYFSNLNVELKYLYTQTFQREISVRRKENSAFVGFDNDKYGNCTPWEHWLEDEEKCISNCEFCSEEGNNDLAECAVSEKRSSFSSLTKSIGKNYGCVYNREECVSAGDNCLQENNNFCMPGTYCGEPECSYDPKKNHKPQVNLEKGVPDGRIIFYCQDQDNTLDLVNACGCDKTAYYMILPQGVNDCNKYDISQYTQITNSQFNPSTARMYYTIDSNDIQSNPKPEAICLMVEDASGVKVVKKAFFDCADQEICFHN